MDADVSGDESMRAPASDDRPLIDDVAGATVGSSCFDITCFLIILVNVSKFVSLCACVSGVTVAVLVAMACMRAQSLCKCEVIFTDRRSSPPRARHSHCCPTIYQHVPA